MLGVCLLTAGFGARFADAQENGNRLGATVSEQNRIRAAGIRRIPGKYLTLYTDIPDRPDVDELVKIFDLAIPQWCEYFSMDLTQVGDWHFSGMIIADQQRFLAAGLFPEDLPPFPAGYQRDDNFWVFLQPGDYYTRHLVLHEGTHAFMNRAFGRTGDPWYAEGIAELLAVHFWDGERLQLNYRDNRRNDVPYWGRVKIIKEAVAADAPLQLAEILAASIEDFREIQWYAWAWAACRFFDSHPRYQADFRRIQSHLKQDRRELTKPFWSQLDHKESMAWEWNLFLREIEYGIDLPHALPSLAQRTADRRFQIRADRGWQDTQLDVAEGEQITISADGEFIVRDDGSPWKSHANGVTIAYFNQKPLGQLVAAIGAEEDLQTGELVAISIGKQATLTAHTSGRLFLKINDHPAELQENRGALQVEIDRN